MQKHKKNTKHIPELNEARLWQSREETQDNEQASKPMKKVKKTNSSENHNQIPMNANTLVLSLLPNQGQQIKPSILIKDIVRTVRSTIDQGSNGVENIVFSKNMDTAYVKLKHKTSAKNIPEQFASKVVHMEVEKIQEEGLNIDKELKRNPKWKCFDIDGKKWKRRISSSNLKNENANRSYMSQVEVEQKISHKHIEPVEIENQTINIKMEMENKTLKNQNKKLQQKRSKLAHEKEDLLKKIELLKKQHKEHEENIARIAEEEAVVNKRKETLKQKVQETEKLFLNIIADTKVAETKVIPIPSTVSQTPNRKLSKETEDFITSGRQTKEKSSRRKGLEEENLSRVYQNGLESAKMHINYDHFELPEKRESAIKVSADKERLRIKESLTNKSLTKQQSLTKPKQSALKENIEPVNYVLIEDDPPEPKESLRKSSVDKDWLKTRESVTKQSITKQSLTKQSLTKQSLTKISASKLSASKQSLAKQLEWNDGQFESLQRMREELVPIYNHKSLNPEKWLSSHVIDDYLDLKYPYQANITIFKTYALPQIGKCIEEKKFTLAKLIRSYLKPVTEAQEIFEKTALIFPVNTFGSHWSLFVVCNPFTILKSQEDQTKEQLSFLYLDSKYHRSDKPYDKWILNFLRECANECGEEVNEEIFKNPPKMFFPCVAKQTNDSDCGLFMLDYIETMNNLMSYERRDHIELYKREEIRQELMNFI